MKRYLAVPDSFKGTLTSGQICDILADCVRRCDPSARLRARISRAFSPRPKARPP